MSELEPEVEEFYGPVWTGPETLVEQAPTGTPTTGVSFPFPPYGTGKETETASGSSAPTLWLPFAPIGTKLANVPTEPDWLWQGWVCRTVLTLVAGLPKVGKSTLIFGLLRALRDGQAFLDGATSTARALLLTEEREATLAQKKALFGLDDDDVHVLMRHEVRDTPWKDVVEQATAYALQLELALLIVDTIDKWMPLVGEGAENDTGQTVRGFLPLMEAASAGLAVIPVTHHRKGEGSHGERVRGNTSITGAVDVILELERAKGAFGEQGGRLIAGTSRFASTPESLAVELMDGAFIAIGSKDAAEARVEQAAVLAALREAVRVAGETVNREVIRDKLAERGESLRGETLAQRLAQLVAAGSVVRSGGGKRGDPYRWAPVSFPGAGTAGTENESFADFEIDDPDEELF
jgi:hypothetical protein